MKAHQTQQQRLSTHGRVFFAQCSNIAPVMVTAALVAAQIFTLLQPRPVGAADGDAARRGSLVRKLRQPPASLAQAVDPPVTGQPQVRQSGRTTELNSLQLAGRTTELLAPADTCQTIGDYYTTCFFETTRLLTVTVYNAQDDNQSLFVSCENGNLSDLNTVPCTEIEKIIIEENPDVNGETQFDLRGVTLLDFENLLETLIMAGGGADTIFGSQFGDVIHSDTQDPEYECFNPDPAACLDHIFPWDGNDIIHTGPGNDVTNNVRVDGTNFDNYGDDTVYSNQGADTITGGPGDDWLVYQSGQNMYLDINVVVVGTRDSSPVVDDITVLEVEGVHLTGDGNPNRMDGGVFTGRAVLEGLGQDDTLIGTRQSDTLIGGDADDLLVGNDGNDWLQGDTGFDTLAGGKGSDTMMGGDQDDVISDGQDGNEDSILGGSGIDTFQDILSSRADLIFSNTEYLEQYGAIVNPMVEMEVIEITGSSGDDFIDCSTFDGQVTLDGGAGNDTLTGGMADDLLFSTLGNNLITGGLGDDVLFAGAGNDTLQGGWGMDELDGGNGNDVLRGGNDADTLFGGEGDDRLYGEAGTDTLDGGRGNDTLYGGDDDDLLIMRDSGAKYLSGDAGSDTHDIPYYINTCGPGNVVTSRYITIQEPGNLGEFDQAIYFAGQQVDNIRILLNTLYRTSLAACMYDRITLSPNLDSFTVSSLEGDDTFEVHPSLGIAYTLNGGPHLLGDDLDFYAPPGQFSSDQGERVVTSGYKDVIYSEIETKEFFQEPWRLFMPVLRR